MTEVLVCSTCICRPDVHSVCFERLFATLQGCSVHFVINIDAVNGKSAVTQDETKSHLENMITTKGYSCEFTTPSTPCFLTATHTVLSRASELLKPHMGLVWFEDDKYFRITPAIKDLLRRKDFPNEVHHFWKRAPKCPTFHPCLWGYNAAFGYLFEAFKENDKRDPEVKMMAFWRDRGGKGVSLQHYPGYTRDIGKRWQEENKIRKWNKDDIQGVITYV